MEVQRSFDHLLTDSKRSAAEAEELISVLSATLESTADGIIAVNRDGIITAYNERFLELWGLEHHDISGKPFDEIFHRMLPMLDDPEATRKQFEELLAHADRQTLNSIHLRDGRVIERYSRPKKQNREIVGRVFSYRDVTDRERREREKSESERKLFQFLETLPLGVVVCDREGRLYYLNRKMRAYSDQDLLGGMDLESLVRQMGFRRNGTDEVYPVALLPLARALQGEIGARTDEIELRCRGQRLFFAFQAEPIFAPDGTVEYAVGVLQDLTPLNEQRGRLENSLSLLHAAIESTDDGILVIDTHGKVALYNRRFVELWSIPATVLETRDDSLLLASVLDHFEDPEKFLESVRKVYADPRGETYDMLELKDGRIFERYSLPQKIQSNVVGRVWSFRDVTGRVQAERSLRMNELLKAGVLGAALDAIVSVDFKGRVIEMNAAAEALFGYDRASAVGRDLFDLIVPENRRKDFRADLARFVVTGKRPFASERLEFSAMRKDGTVFPVELAIVRVQLPGMTIFTAFIRDLTEKKRKDEQIQKQNERARFLADASRTLAEARLDLTAILQSAAKGVAEFFGDGCMVRIFSDGQKRFDTVAFHHVENEVRELMARLLPAATDPFDPAAVEEMLKKGKTVLVQGSSDHLKARLNRRFWPAFEQLKVRSWVIVPLRAAGRIVGAVTVFGRRAGYSTEDQLFLQEMADRCAIAMDNARLYEEARAAIRLREDFLAIASHELKTPLTPLRMQLQLLRRFLASGAIVAGGKEKELLNLIESSDRHVNRLSRLVEDMLDTTRIASTQMNDRVEKVELVGLVHQVINHMKPQFRAAGCALELSTEREVEVRGDPIRLEQVVSALLSNAIKFGAGKPVEVSIATDEKEAILSVRDHGIGISDEDQKHVFERFFRAVSFTRFGGLGLGLYLAHQIVLAHGGRITVESKVGEGSTFLVYLPLFRLDS